MSEDPPRFPGEWEPHAATWVFWPTRAEQYLYGGASAFAEVRAAFLRLVDILAAFEPVRVGADPANEEEARSVLGRRAEVVPVPLDDAWARDAAPTFLAGGSAKTAVRWRLTGWGGRFGPCAKDAEAAVRVAAREGATLREGGLALEGGAIHSDGRGTVLTTAAVLHDPGRGAEGAAGQRRERLAAALGAERVLELPAGFAGDDTGGHVDVVAAFSPDGAVLLNDCGEPADPNAAGSRRNAECLRAEEREVVAVPQPEARFAGGDRLAYSYLNFYPCNGAVLVPAFGDRRDGYARGLIAERYPGREPVAMDARPFYLGGGGIHCVTQPVFR